MCPELTPAAAATVAATVRVLMSHLDARSVALALGSEAHPIAEIVAKLAEQNMSAFARQRMERRRQQVCTRPC